MVEIRFQREMDPEALDRTLGLLSPDVWAVESFGSLLLALVPLNDPEQARVRVEAVLATERSNIRTIEASRGKAIEDWVGLRPQASAVQVGPLWFGRAAKAPSASMKRWLSIESKNAFGSGLHETTHLCLERLLELSPLESVLDIGTGTGILALAALALGAREAVGLDIDAAAVRAAQRNAFFNNFGDRFSACDTPIEAIDRQYPLVIANVITASLIALAPVISRTVAKDGLLLLSGIRDYEVDRVAAAYTLLGWSRGETKTRGTWARLELRRPHGKRENT